MAKITIDDIEYQTDDFTDRQKEIYQDMLNARSEMSRLEYLYRVLESRGQSLAKALAEPELEVVSEEASDG